MMTMMMSVHVELVQLVMTTTMTTTGVVNRVFVEQACYVWDTVGHDSTTRVPDAV